MSSSPLSALEPTERGAEDARPSGLVELLLDSLSAWTVLAAAIAFLYLVWATIEILDRYVGVLPKVVL